MLCLIRMAYCIIAGGGAKGLSAVVMFLTSLTVLSNIKITAIASYFGLGLVFFVKYVIHVKLLTTLEALLENTNDTYVRLLSKGWVWKQQRGFPIIICYYERLEQC